MTRGGLPHSETPGSGRVCRSPGIIAAYRVLHRLVMPRHPSCARMRLAGGRRPSGGWPRATPRATLQLFCSQTKPVVKDQKTVTPRRGKSKTVSPPRGGISRPPPTRAMVGAPGVEPGASSLSGTRSNHLSYAPRPGGGSRGRTGGLRLAKPALCRLSYAPSGAAALGAAPARPRGPPGVREKESGSPALKAASPRPAPRGAACLLRKEVIQPLVPQRLPCYDFIPITAHTLGGCPPRGLAPRLRVQKAFMM